MKMLGRGVYNFAEAAKYTGLRPKRVKEWFLGRTLDPTPRPVLLSDYPIVNGTSAISFLDLIEVFVAGQFRTSGVPLQLIRKAHARLRLDWDVPHPFAQLRIRTDGRAIFALSSDEPNQIEIQDVMTRNLVFESVILPTLDRVDYDQATEQACRWHLSPSVVLDPAISFGKPIVAPTGIATKILSGAYYANGQDAKAVASWFGVKDEHVLAAVEFEDRYAA